MKILVIFNENTRFGTSYDGYKLPGNHLPSIFTKNN